MDDVYGQYREALKLGHQEAAAGRFAQALRHYTAAAELAPDRALPHIAVGGMQLRLGHARESLVAYDRALQNEPTNIDALTGRAAALLAAGRRDEANKVQQQIIDIRRAAEMPSAFAPADATDMSKADTLHAAGQIALTQGNQDVAIDAWLAESAEHASADHLDAALDAALAAVSIAPSAPRIHLQLVRLYFQRGWSEKAVERALLLDRLLTLDPEPTVHEQLRKLAAQYVAADQRLATLANPQA
jgi:tetratricopeptide (TPR) repeat protein